MPKSKGPNKSAFIRSMPAAHPSDIVKAAEAQGIKLTPSFVYAIRAMDKHKTKGSKGRPKARGAKSKAAEVAPAKKAAAHKKADAACPTDLRHQFVALAMRIGTDEAQRLLDRIVDVQTPMAAFKR